MAAGEVSEMIPQPADGERRASTGYRNQYLVGAGLILNQLNSRQLEWIRVADPEAGRVDDLQIATASRVDAYQVKWSQYRGTITLGDLCGARASGSSWLGQLADGWRRLRSLNPQRRVVVHFVTNKHASTSARNMPAVENPPSPYHLAAFFEQAWQPARTRGQFETAGAWAPLWETLRASGGLSAEEFQAFVSDCSIELGVSLPEEHPDIVALVELLFATAASPERIIELSHDELLRRLGWKKRYEYRNLHNFPSSPFLYRPIRATAEALESAITGGLAGGYIGVFGSPGSGKSTVLTQSLRSLPVRLIAYYAYVPEAQDPTVLRGESLNFLHDITLQLQRAGFGRTQRPDPSDRSTLLALLHEQLQGLGQDFEGTGRQTVILVDGLDHIVREQQPERSLLRDLPLPEGIPHGVFIVIGSQTDDLPDLPPRVQHALRGADRRLEMGSLSRSDVDAIAVEAVPGLLPEELPKVFEISGGHPLALIYLLRQLQQAADEEIRLRLLAEAPTYEGDIEAQYWAHWRGIENDHDLVHALALLARVRGPISMRWVSTWLDDATLGKLQRLFVQYFHEEGEASWRFFHNSFRLFLEAQTAQPLPGRTPEEMHRVHHLELAQRYEGSAAPWKWETIYHLYSGGEFDAVIRMGTFDWFLDQVRNLRPIDGIQTDARLALKAAGENQDVTAIIRLTLIGAALEQRSWALENSLLPDLLLEAGQPVKAAEHLRDGNRLRVEANQALRLSSRLASAGLQKEGRNLFDLAEPLELLSGRPIPDDHTRPQDLWELLAEWVRAATFFRKVDDVVQLVQRIRVRPSPWREVDEEQESRRLQNWLLLEGASACSQRSDWEGWQVIHKALDTLKAARPRLFALLRAARQAMEQDDRDRARALLGQILEGFRPKELGSVEQSYQLAEIKIALAETVLQVLGDTSIAEAWLADITPIPLEDRGLHLEREPSLVDLRFRLASLHYLLGEDRDPKALQEEAETHTTFGDYVEDDEKAGYRQFALAAYSLARLWAWARLGSPQSPAAFVQQVDWILDLISGGWATSSASFRMNTSNFRSEILEVLVEASAEQGREVLAALAGEFEARWVHPTDGKLWSTHLQREIAAGICSAGGDQSWAAAQLRRIEPHMLDGLDPHGRVEACQDHSKAWLTVGDTNAALSVLHTMCEVAGGIRSEKDYQLGVWVRWLDRINGLEQDAARERLRLMLRRVLAVEGSASGVVEASEELLAAAFHWSPRRSVGLLKGLLENHTVGHEGAVSRLLREALVARRPPIKDVLHAASELIIPLVSGTEPELLEAVITHTAKQSGPEAGLEAARLLTRRIMIDAPANNRHAWNRAIVAGLDSFGYTATSVGLEERDLEDQAVGLQSDLNRNLHLKGGEEYSPTHVLRLVRTVDDMRLLLEAEDRSKSSYFSWGKVIAHLAPNLMSVAQIKDVEALATGSLGDESLREHELASSLTAISRRALELHDQSMAWDLAQKAIGKTSPSGWDPYFDGGAKHAVIGQLVSIDAEEARPQIVRLYVNDLSERFQAPTRILPHLDDVLMLLTGEIPVVETWASIEAYLTDLFSGSPVAPQPELEATLDEDLDPLVEDAPDRAVADLILLYMDHPSFPVAQAAVRTASASLIDGSEAMYAVLLEAIRGDNKPAERVLMVLDAVSIQKANILEPFLGELHQLRSSPDFTIRLIAEAVLSRLTGAPIGPMRTGRELPAIYRLQLPTLAHHDTLKSIRGDEGAVAIGDPALALRPLDIELRVVARIAGVSEDAALLRAFQHYQAHEPERKWLRDDSPLTWSRLSAFLDQTGLRVTTSKPHIAPARRALAHVIGDLFDSGRIPEDAIPTLEHMLLRHDPAFILNHPDRRPGFIGPIGGLASDHGYLMRIPDGWIDESEESLLLLHPRTPEGWVVVAEWSGLRRLDDHWPDEERASVVRAVPADLLWDGLDVEKGHRPFHRITKCQSDAYLTQRAPMDHIVIAHEPHDFETPGARWLALNPLLGQQMGWELAGKGWFRWIDRKGETVVESLWWADGPEHSYNSFLHVEVGGGWLVVMTEEGFEEVSRRMGQACRGGMVRRRIGWNGTDGECSVTRMLSL